MVFHNDALCTRAIKAWNAEEVVHGNGQVMQRGLLFHQYIGTILQEIKSYTLERDVVWVPIYITATYNNIAHEVRY